MSFSDTITWVTRQVKTLISIQRTPAAAGPSQPYQDPPTSYANALAQQFGVDLPAYDGEDQLSWTPDSLAAALANLLPSSMTRPMSGIETECSHPALLAGALNRPLAQDWDASIYEVQLLVNKDRTMLSLLGLTAPAASAPTTYSEFRITEIPEFSEYEKYFTWRFSFLRFAESTRVAQHDVGIALNKVFTRFNGSVAEITDHFKIDIWADLPWDAAVSALVAALDEKFLSVGLLDECEKKFYALRHSALLNGKPYTTEYQKRLFSLREAAAVKGITELNDDAAKIDFMRRLPANIRAQFAIHHKRPTELSLPALYNEYQTFCHALELEGRLYPVAKPKTASAPAPAAASTSASASVPAVAASSSLADRNTITVRFCGLKCNYESPAPAVPHEFRGPLYARPGNTPDQQLQSEARRAACQAADICESCRRPRSAHTGKMIFRPVGIARQ